jgi:hypothetical protein
MQGPGFFPRRGEGRKNKGEQVKEQVKKQKQNKSQLEPI